MTATNNWYAFEGAEQVDSPALVIYRDRVIANIEKVTQLVPASLLRPHIKTSKSADVTRLMLAAGITKFKCATIAEAEMLGRSGAPDVLLAYQPTINKLERLLHLIAAYPQTKYSCLVDDASVAEMISKTVTDRELVMPVFIDLNVGMNRTGIVPEKAFDLYNKIKSLDGLEFKGLHAYDGHIRAIDVAERTAEVDAAFKTAEELRGKIAQTGAPFPLLVAGGSPSFAILSKRKNVECSPGTFVFWDKGYQDNIPEQEFKPAALVLTRIVSFPAPGKICIDMGYKAVSCENDLQKRIYFLNAPELKPSSHSEEHMVLTAPENHQYKIGDILYGLPIHVCPTVAMYNQATVVADGRVSDIWTITARGRELEDGI